MKSNLVTILAVVGAVVVAWIVVNLLFSVVALAAKLAVVAVVAVIVYFAFQALFAKSDKK